MQHPSPSQARSFDDLAVALAELRAEAGSPSFSEIAKRVGTLRMRRGARRAGAAPGRVTVYDAFRAGRSRMDVELVADIVAVLGRPQDVHVWRSAHAQVMRDRAAERKGRVSTLRSRVARMQPPATDLVGRSAELTALYGHCSGPVGGDVRMALITGLPGAGKTALARAAAARVGEALPDHPVIEATLRTNVEAGEEPIDGDALAALLLSEFPETREGPVILLADDVPDGDVLIGLAEHLQPGSILIGTSRRRLDLAHRALVVVLGGLDRDEALGMLAGGIGVPGGSDASLERLVELCGGMPLAIELLAAQVRTQDGWTLDDHVERLERASGGALGPVLKSAYEESPPPARRALRFLGAHHGRLTAEEAGVMLGTVAPEPDGWVHTALRELELRHLITRAPDGRSDLHDTVRALAVEEASRHEPLSLRRRAVAALAEALLHRIHGEPSGTAAVDAFLADVDTHVATVALAAELDMGPLVEEYAGRLNPWLKVTQRLSDQVIVNEHARRVASHETRPAVIIRLSEALTASGRLAEAEIILSTLVTGTGPQTYRALGHLGMVASLRGDYELAVERTRRAAELALAAGDEIEAATCQAQAASALSDLGRLDEALEAMNAALGLLGESTETYHETLRAVILCDRAIAEAWSGRVGHAFESVAAARRTALRIGHRPLAAYADALEGAATVLSGRAEEGARMLADASVKLESSGRANVWTEVHLFQGMAAFRQEDLRAAQRFAAEALDAAERHGFRDSALWARLMLGRVALLEGRLEDAAVTLQAVEREARTPRLRGFAAWLSGEVELAGGRQDQAVQWWRKAADCNPPVVLARLLDQRIHEQSPALL